MWIWIYKLNLRNTKFIDLGRAIEALISLIKSKLFACSLLNNYQQLIKTDCNQLFNYFKLIQQAIKPEQYNAGCEHKLLRLYIRVYFTKNDMRTMRERDVML